MLRASAIAALAITPSKLNEPDLIEASKLRRAIVQMAHDAGKPAVDHRVLVNELPSSLSGHHLDALNQLNQSATLKRFDTMIRNRGAYSEAYVSGMPPHFADQKRSAIRSATSEMDALTDEILAIVNQQEAIAA
jgi:chromosome partitioning protein